MPTRFYFPQNPGGNEVSPAYDSAWDTVLGASRHPLASTKQETAFTSHGLSSNAAKRLARQYVSSQLEAQTISGYFKGQFRCYENSSGYDVNPAITVRVVSGDGSTVRGILLSYFPESNDNELATSYTNRQYPSSIALTPVECQHGDRLVVEIGTKQFNGYYAMTYIEFGDYDMSDLPEDNTNTSQYCPWIEFSQDLDFYDPLAHPYSGSIGTTVTPSSVKSLTIEKDGDQAIVITPSSTHYYQGPGEFITLGHVGIDVTPSGDIVTDMIYAGNVFIDITPSVNIYRYDCAYIGEIPVEITVSGVTRIPVEGWDKETGYGIVDITFIIDPPPYWGMEGDIKIDLSSASDISLYAEKNVVPIGGVKFGGNLAVISFIDPPTMVAPGSQELAGNIEVIVGGGRGKYDDLNYEFITPEVAATRGVVGSGGIELGGAPQRVFSQVDVIAVVASGGMELCGNGVDGSSTVTTRVVAASGGLWVAGSDLPTYSFLRDVEQSAGANLQWFHVAISGDGVVEFVSPLSTDLSLDYIGDQVRVGDLLIGGGGLTTVIIPVTIPITADGGVAIGGGNETPVYETWILSGLTFEPALYSGFAFNSYASHGGKIYAATADGIFELGGDSDNGARIRPGVRIGPTTFGANKQKRVRCVNLGDDPGDDVQAKFSAGKSSNVVPLTRGRLPGTRGVAGSHITIDLADFEQIGAADIDVVVLARR